MSEEKKVSITPENINIIIGQAKSNLNASKGRANGLVDDATNQFIDQCGQIINTLLARIAELEPKKEESKPAKNGSGNSDKSG